MSLPFRIKQGQSLIVALVLRDRNGAPLDATTCSFASQLRDASSNLVATLNFVATGGPGQAIATVAGSVTATWTPGVFQGDVFVTTGGVIVPSHTFVVLVQRAVTIL